MGKRMEVLLKRRGLGLIEVGGFWLFRRVGGLLGLGFF